MREVKEREKKEQGKRWGIEDVEERKKKRK